MNCRPFICGAALTGIFCGLIVSASMLYALWFTLAAILTIWDIHDVMLCVASGRAIAAFRTARFRPRRMGRAVFFASMLLFPIIAVSTLLPGSCPKFLLYLLTLMASIVLVQKAGYLR